MPRPRRAAAQPLSLGFAGSGELDAKALTALLDDLVGESEIEALYVPVTKDDYSEEVAAVVAWATDNDIPYTTISDEDASKDRALKKVISAGTEDYDAGDSAGKAIVELLAGSEDEPVADGRLLMFFDANEEEDVAVFEEAHDLEVAAFDLCDGLSPMHFGDDEPEPAAEPEPETEPAPVGPRRRKAAAEKAAAAEEGEEDEQPTREELLALPLTELKKRAKALDPQANTTESMRGLQKPDVIELLLGAEEPADEPADEAQAEPPARRGRRAAAAEAPAADVAGDDPADDAEADSREMVFARLKGQREAAERITRTLTKVSAELIDAASEEGGDDAAFETAAAIVASSLMIFADFIVTEVRKPKSAGRPRKDGTEAQPKPPAAEKTTRRGRRAAAE